MSAHHAYARGVPAQGWVGRLPVAVDQHPVREPGASTARARYIRPMPERNTKQWRDLLASEVLAAAPTITLFTFAQQRFTVGLANYG